MSKMFLKFELVTVAVTVKKIKQRVVAVKMSA